MTVFLFKNLSMLPSSYQIMLFLLANANSALFLSLSRLFSSHPKKFMTSSLLSHVFLTGSTLPTIRVAISSSFCLMLICGCLGIEPSSFCPCYHYRLRQPFLCLLSSRTGKALKDVSLKTNYMKKILYCTRARTGIPLACGALSC